MTSMPILKCECCSFECKLKTDYNRHILSAKHIANSKSDTVNDTKNIIDELKRNYQEQLAEQKIIYEERLAEQKKQYEERLAEQKDIINKLIERQITTTTTVNKPVFSAEEFLNDKCKDAMNIITFKNSIVVTEEHALSLLTKDFGSVMVTIIRENFDRIGGKFHRPIHFTDKSRNVKYVKNEYNEWIVEDEKQSLLFSIANKITMCLMILINDYQKKNFSKAPKINYDDEYDSDEHKVSNRNDDRVAINISNMMSKIEIDKDKLLKQINSLKHFCYIRD